jgi:predicted GNAT family acetyltransferase
VNAKNRGEYFSISPQSIPALYRRLNMQLKHNMALIAVALDDDAIVGSMYATFSHFPTRKNLAKFNKLTVNPDHRGQGIAKRLFTELEAAVKKQGKTVSGFYCHADNPARKLYQTMGYKEETRPDCSSDCLISLHKEL